MHVLLQRGVGGGNRSQRMFILVSFFIVKESHGVSTIVPCKGQSGTKCLVKYDLPTRSYGCRSGWFCIRLPAWGLSDLAEVRIMIFSTCCTLSYYGPSVRPVKTSISVCSNTESDA